MPESIIPVYASLIALGGLGGLAFTVLREVKGPIYSFVSKTLASLLFVVCGIVFTTLMGAWTKGYVLAIVLGLFFGMIGDVLLDLKRNFKDLEGVFLSGGMLSFGIGHVMYFLFAFFYVSDVLGKSFLIPGLVGLAALPIALIVVIAAKKLGLNLGSHMYQTLAYLTVLAYMTIMAITAAGMYSTVDNRLWHFAMAMAMFISSDLTLSFTYFGDKSKKGFMTTCSVVNHVLYYAAQLAIASLIVFIA